MRGRHRVTQGECLAEIAAKHGFASWKTIWDHPDNEALRSRRRDPNLLHPGDVLVIPAQRERRESASTEQRARFTRKRPTKPLRLKLREGKDEQRLPGRAYVLKIQRPDGHPDDLLEYPGTIDEEGALEEQVPVGARKGTLEIELDDSTFRLPILIDHLDPVEEPTGVQARLNNLGFDCGGVDGKVGPMTRDALRRFQADRELEPTGELDSATMNALRREHGC